MNFSPRGQSLERRSFQSARLGSKFVSTRALCFSSFLLFDEQAPYRDSSASFGGSFVSSAPPYFAIYARMFLLDFPTTERMFIFNFFFCGAEAKGASKALLKSDPFVMRDVSCFSDGHYFSPFFFSLLYGGIETAGLL